MKRIIFILLLMAQSALAGVCDFSYTFDLDEAVEAGDIELIKVSRDHSAFTLQEKQLIAETVLGTMGTHDPRTFSQRPGAGEVWYIKDQGKLLALVRFWPGDTEVGMIFHLFADGKSERLAVIGDSHIDCN